MVGEKQEEPLEVAKKGRVKEMGWEGREEVGKPSRESFQRHNVLCMLNKLIIKNEHKHCGRYTQSLSVGSTDGCDTWFGAV
jgi:hypothetical protein